MTADDVLVFYSPVESTEDVLAAVFAAGAGPIGAYTECAWFIVGSGQFRPGAGPAPPSARSAASSGCPSTVWRWPRDLRREVGRAPGGASLRGAGLPRHRDGARRSPPPLRDPRSRLAARGPGSACGGGGSRMAAVSGPGPRVAGVDHAAIPTRELALPGAVGPTGREGWERAGRVAGSAAYGMVVLA